MVPAVSDTLIMPIRANAVYQAYLEATKDLPPPVTVCVTPQLEVFKPETQYDEVGLTVCRPDDEEDSDDDGMDEFPDILAGFIPGITRNGALQVGFHTQRLLPGQYELTPEKHKEHIKAQEVLLQQAGMSKLDAVWMSTATIPYDSQRIPPKILEELELEIPEVPQSLQDLFDNSEFDVKIEVCFAQQHSYNIGRCPSPASIRTAFWAHTEEDRFEDGSWMDEVFIPVSFDIPDDKAVKLFKYAIRQYTKCDMLYM